MVITSVFWSLGAVPLDAVRTTLAVPAVVGLPEMAAPLKVKPPGRGDAVKVIGVLPVAVTD